MKTSLSLMFILPVLIVGVQRVPAQSPVIVSFSQNGVLVCSNLGPGSVATVTWASSLSGPWQTNWAGLSEIPVTSNGTVQVSVPMFYRVLVRTNSGPANMVLR